MMNSTRTFSYRQLSSELYLSLSSTVLSSEVSSSSLNINMFVAFVSKSGAVLELQEIYIKINYHTYLQYYVYHR